MPAFRGRFPAQDGGRGLWLPDQHQLLLSFGHHPSGERSALCDKNGFSNEGIATHEIVIEDGVESSDTGEDIEAKLIKLSSLYEQRLITKEEYDEKRKQLLDELV